MSPQNRPWLVAALLAVAAALWLWHSGRQLRRLRQNLQAVQQSQAALDEQTLHLKQDRARQAAEAPALAAAKLARGSSSSPASTRAKMDSRVAALVDNPKLQAAYLAARKAQLDRLYGPLFKSLNLAPGQAEQLKSLLTQRMEQELDLVSAVPAAVHMSNSGGNQWFTSSLGLDVGGGSTRDPDVRAALDLMQQADASFQSSATDLLGADGYKQFDAYARALPMRSMADDLAGALATGANPLTPDQLDQLTQLLAQSSASYAKGRPANPGQIDWTQALQQAGSLLSPPQLSAFKAAVGVRRAGPQLNGLIRAATAGP
jgi:hypothetical protein